MMGGNPRDLARQMQQMQTRLAKIQEELGSETVEASVGGGMITIVMTGHQVVESVKIDPDAVDPEDVETLQDLMVAAYNEALQKSQELASTRLGALTGGMNIPGLMYPRSARCGAASLSRSFPTTAPSGGHASVLVRYGSSAPSRTLKGSCRRLSSRLRG